MVNFVEPALLIKLKGMPPGPRDLLTLLLLTSTRYSSSTLSALHHCAVARVAALGAQSYEQRCPEQKRERM